jgi:hypothetical protein
MAKYGLWTCILAIAMVIGTLGGDANAQQAKPMEEPGAVASTAATTVASETAKQQLEPQVPSASAPTTSGNEKTESKPTRKGSALWWGSDSTAGWSLMSWKERNEHRKKMRAMKSYEECKSYLDLHHERMRERARARGVPMSEPKHDSCAALKP